MVRFLSALSLCFALAALPSLATSERANAVVPILVAAGGGTVVAGGTAMTVGEAVVGGAVLVCAGGEIVFNGGCSRTIGAIGRSAQDFGRGVVTAGTGALAKARGCGWNVMCMWTATPPDINEWQRDRTFWNRNGNLQGHLDSLQGALADGSLSVPEDDDPPVEPLPKEFPVGEPIPAELYGQSL